MRRLPAPLLALITDDRLATVEIETAVGAACDAGCPLVQLRHRTLTTAELTGFGHRLRRITAERGSMLLVNERIDVALAIGADGVHLPARGMTIERARSLVGDLRLVGRSVHSTDEIRELRGGDVDYLQFGPVFRTASKAAYGPPQELAGLGAAVAAARGVAVVAVGGITAARAASVMATGARGIAVIGAVMGAAMPGSAAAELLETLRS